MRLTEEIIKIKNLTKNVEGFLTDREGVLLYKLASKCSGKGVIVEIGSWKGKSTIWLAKGSKINKNIKIYAIDPHTGSQEHIQKYGNIWTFDEFKNNLKKAQVDDIVVPLVEYSHKAKELIKEPIELLFIDGAHEYEAVKLDYELYFPLLIEGGFLIFHDTDREEVRLVADRAFNSKYFKNVYFSDTITYGQKVKINSIKDKIKNNLMISLRNQFHFICSSHQRKFVKKFYKNFIKLCRNIIWIL